MLCLYAQIEKKYVGVKLSPLDAALYDSRETKGCGSFDRASYLARPPPRDALAPAASVGWYPQTQGLLFGMTPYPKCSLVKKK